MLKTGLLVCFTLIISNCTIEKVDAEDNIVLQEYKLLNEYNEKHIPFIKNYLIDLFINISLGSEFGNGLKLTKKWKKKMKVFFNKKENTVLFNEINLIVNEINYLTTDGFKIEIVEDVNDANMVIYFGEKEEFAFKFGVPISNLLDNSGFVSVNINNNREIENGIVFIDSKRTTLIDQKHLIREELTQGLGLLNDILYHKESIFYNEHIPVTEYSNYDREIIRLLYNPKIITGMDSIQVRYTLKRILGI